MNERTPLPQRSRGLLLAGIGAFGIAAALAVLVSGTSFVGTLLPTTDRTTATGDGLVVFYPGDLALRTGVSVRQTTNVAATTIGAGPDTAAYDVGSVLTDTRGTLLGVSTYTFCVGRDTRLGRPCDTTPPPGTGPPFGGGLVTFPVGTQRHEYHLTVPGVAVSAPVTYARDVEVDGLTVYRFEQDVPEAVTDRREVPGLLAGERSAAPVPAELLASARRTFWVEPTSGVVVMQADRPVQVLRGPDGKLGPPLLFGTVHSDARTVADAATRASALRTRILLVTVVLPPVLGLTGAVLLAVGSVLTLRAPARAIGAGTTDADDRSGPGGPDGIGGPKGRGERTQAAGVGLS